MENSILYDTKSIRFIRIIFRITLFFTIVGISLLFLLQINDSIKFNEGSIYSNNPQVKINAPNEVKILKINVAEGEEVKKGDTIFELENLKTQADFDIVNLDVTTLEEKIKNCNLLINSSVQEKTAMQRLIAIQSNIFSTDKKKTEQEIKNLNSKIGWSKKQSNDITERYKTDSILYAKGAISKLELSEQSKNRIDDKKQESDITTNYQIKKYDYNNLANNYQKTASDLKLNIIAIDNQILNYKGQILELQSQIDNKKVNMKYFKDELGKLIVLSPFNGTISNLFNDKQNLQIINKGELLTIISPNQENYYSKVVLTDKDLIYVKKGQEVNLKLDAYNFYKYGAIKGVVSYVSESDINNKFFCIVKLKKYNERIKLKAGYSLKGEIVIDKMSLLNYMMKKLFKKLD
ncbi:HlyD family secretion protein [Flavobacterium sp.]|uniref:HlyD family secretion protein n=1 Tax=Flavobacterium sp. TaxID=239 RepID=UPI0037537E3D